MHEQLVLPRRARSVGAARAFVSDALRDLATASELDSAVLLTSELVTNAVEHGEGEAVTIHVRRGISEVRVEVVDTSPLLPAQRQADVLDEHGRGIALVASLAHDCGAHLIHTQHEFTKVVWFALGCS